MAFLEFFNNKHVIMGKNLNGIIEEEYDEGYTTVINTNTKQCQIIFNDTCKNPIDIIKEIYSFQESDNEYLIMINIKKIALEQKVQVLKYALTYEALQDPLMLLNILNLVKTYNTLDDTYFESNDIYVNSIEELLDLKLELGKDLKEFSRKLSIYFLSLIKSYNKMSFTPADEHIKLPNLYSAIILSTDFLTLSGIMAKTNNINIDDLIYIDNAYIYMSSLLTKGMNSTLLIDEFLTDNEGVI